MRGLVLLAIFLLTAPALDAASGPVVRLDSGAVRGVRLAATEAFLGIPYAQPPVGALRWRDPQPLASWSGVRAATVRSPACMQSPPRAFGPFTAEFLIPGPVSEDCLYLNVWKPRGANSRLPVFLYIHGGGFGSGSANVPIYDGSALAARGVVVITINYRVGVFGFFAHPDLAAESPLRSSGNYGLLDMIAALHWVRANAARFGGDSNNITIAGQSAGAAAVNDLLLSPLASGLFQRAIAMSGSGMGIHAIPRARAEEVATSLASRMNAQSIAELRSIDANQLQAATDIPPPATSERPRAPPIVFAPNLDGVVLGADREDATAKHHAGVPLLTGFAADEGLALGAPKSPEAFEDMVRERYGAFAERLLRLYPHATVAQFEQSLAELARDRYMAALAIWAERRSQATGQSVFTYLYRHPYPPNNGKAFGAFHTAEVPYLFGALRHAGRSFGSRDRAVARELQDHWIAFMRHGDPSLPKRPWPKVSANTFDVMELGGGTGLRAAVSTPERLALLREYVAAGGQLSLF